MTPPHGTIRRRAARAVVLVVMLLSAIATPPAGAEPMSTRAVRAVPAANPSIVTSNGDVQASLEATSFAIPVDDPYGFTGRIATTKDTDSVQMRLKVFNPSGKLMTQRTFIINDPDAGEAVASFTRATNDLGLSPGAYPVALEVRVSSNGTVDVVTLQSDLLIYDPAGAELPVAFSVRVSGQPLADPQGRFVADPGQFTRARDDARQIAEWVLGNPDARMTMALSPLLLEEWQRISQGYVFAGPEGMTSVPASDSVSVAYAQTLDTLGRAAGTGRLELASLGYTDPNLAELSAHEMAPDVTPQYAEGISAVYASIESTPSTGTIPAGGCVPPTALAAMAEQGVKYVVLQPEFTRSGSSTATTGLYLIKKPAMKVLVADEQASEAVSGGDRQTLLRRAFEMRLSSAGAPLVVSCEVGAGQTAASEFTLAADEILAQPWIELQRAGEAAAKKPKKAVELVTPPASNDAPSGYWAEVQNGRRWARALSGALGQGAPDAVTAHRDSLIAQASAWAGVDGGWVLADRGRSFASTAVRLARDTLDPIELRVEPVTLAGSSGDVPITIKNGSDRSLTVRLSTRPSGGVRVAGDGSQSVQLPPQDTFIELPVEMPESLAGELAVSVSSGGMVLETQVVPIRASYLDRLVMIVGVVIVLGILMFVVARRARLAAAAPEESGTMRDRGSEVE